MFEVFDTPITSQSCPVRDVTTVAPQALWGLNNRSVFRQAIHMAGRVVREAGGSRTDQIKRACRIALGRPPDSEELKSAESLLDTLERGETKLTDDVPESLAGLSLAHAAALAKLCLVLFNLSEFAFVD